MENNKKDTSIINKLKAKLTTPKIVKIVAGIIVTGAVVGTIAFAVPKFINNDNSNNFNDVVGGILNNGGNNGNSNNGSNNSSETKCSQMLENVLNDEYYNQLIASAMKNTDLFESAEFDPHPYAFLEDQGFDVDKIKSGQTACYSMTYVLDEEPNNLYMQTRVLVNNSYYHTYLLKYTLTDQEMADYRYMHGQNNRDHYYTKAVFLNNEISEMKTPEILGTSKFYKEDLDSIIRRFPNNWETQKPSNNFEVIALEPNGENNTVKIVLYPLHGSKMYVENSSIVIGDYLTQDYLRFDGDICKTSLTIYEPITEEKKSADVFSSEARGIGAGLLDHPYEK